MRVILPKLETQKLMFEYLRDNKSELIEQKCTLPIKSESLHAPTSIGENHFFATKSITTELKATVMNDSIIVDAVANLSCWMDSHMDVSAPDSWKKSIQERGKKMVWLADHAWSIRNKIAKTLDVYAMDLDLKTLGIKSDIRTAQGLIFQGEFNPKYDALMFEKYSSGMVDQHSIGLQYVQIDLAINDPEDKTNYKNWEKYYPMIINKEEADKRGFFWWVKEQKVFENSAVLFGSNEMTPTISTQTAESLGENKAGIATLETKEPISKEHLERLQKIFKIN